MDLFRKTKNDDKNEGNYKTLILKVSGMHCYGCDQSVKKSLSKINGIRDIDADFVKQEVKMSFDENKVNLEKIRGVIRKAGFIPGVEKING